MPTSPVLSQNPPTPDATDPWRLDSAADQAALEAALADPAQRARFVAAAAGWQQALRTLTDEHADLAMMHDAILEHATEIEEQLARKVEEVESLVADLEVRNGLIQKLFGRYVSDEVVATLLEQQDAVSARGQHRYVSMLMSDLRGFSGICERLPPEHVVDILNTYLEAMDTIIGRHGGVINDFHGDAILAVFGAPVLAEDHRERAVACAIAMQNEMEAVAERNRMRGLPTVEMGVGVHAGEVVVGSIGSDRRARYTVVGRHANLTSRIESYTVGGQVLVSDAVYQQLGPLLRVRGAFPVAPKGFAETFTLHDVAGIDGTWAVELLPPSDRLDALLRPLAVVLYIVDGKQVVGQPLQGTLERLSQRRAEVRLTRPLRPLTDVRVDLPGVESPDPLYAKSVPGGVDGREMLRFTSTSTALDALIAHLPLS